MITDASSDRIDNSNYNAALLVYASQAPELIAEHADAPVGADKLIGTDHPMLNDLIPVSAWRFLVAGSVGCDHADDSESMMVVTEPFGWPEHEDAEELIEGALLAQVTTYIEERRKIVDALALMIEGGRVTTVGEAAATVETLDKNQEETLRNGL